VQGATGTGTGRAGAQARRRAGTGAQAHRHGHMGAPGRFELPPGRPCDSLQTELENIFLPSGCGRSRDQQQAS